MNVSDTIIMGLLVVNTSASIYRVVLAIRANALMTMNEVRQTQNASSPSSELSDLRDMLARKETQAPTDKAKAIKQAFEPLHTLSQKEFNRRLKIYKKKNKALLEKNQ